MEYKVVKIRVPKGMMIPNDCELMFLESDDDKMDEDIELGVIRHPGSVASDKIVCLLVQRPKPLKPNWTPPKLKKGWLTWDKGGGWCWWPIKPDYDEHVAWINIYRYAVGEKMVRMAESLGFPDCSGYDERNCIWEVEA
jgi:hypothetical protein